MGKKPCEHAFPSCSHPLKGLGHYVCKYTKKQKTNLKSIPGADPEIDFEGGIIVFFHVKSFLTLLFAIESITVSGPWPPSSPGSVPDPY